MRTQIFLFGASIIVATACSTAASDDPDGRSAGEAAATFDDRTAAAENVALASTDRGEPVAESQSLAVPAQTTAQSAASAPAPWTQAELEQLSRDIQQDLEVLREAKFTRPVAVKLADKKEFFEYAKARQELTETPEKIAADETIAKLLGVFPAELDMMATTMEFLEDQVGGFYDPASDSFALMDACPQSVAPIILAHELGHALDDQLYSIDSQIEALKGNSDATLAYHAVVEGSGTSVMVRWTIERMKGGEGAEAIDLAGMNEMQAASQDSLAKAPMWLWKPLIAVYLRGASFLARTENVMAGQMGGAKNADIDAAFKSPPRSMEQVLHPEKYWDEGERDEPTVVEFDASAVDAGWTKQREDTMGELLLAILTTAPDQRGGLDASNAMAMMSLRYTNDAAAGWDGDRTALFSKDGAHYLRLVTVWDTEKDAAEFLGAMQVILPTLESAAAAVAAKGSGETADSKARSGAQAAYGEDPKTVVIDAWSGVSSRDRKMFEKKLAHSTRAN